MNLKVKCVATTINLVCIVCTLLYPNQGTPLSLLPAVITATMWIFAVEFEKDKPIQYRGRTGLLILACVLCGLCFLLATISCPIKQSDGGYLLKFSSEIAIFPDTQFPYWFFLCIVLVMISPLYLGDLLYTLKSSSCKDFGEVRIADMIAVHVAEIHE